MQYPQTAYQDSLQSGISDVALSATVTTTAPTRTQGILTLGRLQSNREDVYYTNVVGSVITIGLRGLSTTALTLTEVAGNKKVHAANESIEMTTHHNYDTNKARKDEDETISGNWDFTAKPRVTGLKDSAGNEAVDIDATGSAVNQVRIKNSATGTAVEITTAGDDANIDLAITAKGSGKVKIEDAAEMASAAAPVTNAGIANKKYVDDQVAAVATLGEATTTQVGTQVESSGAQRLYINPKSTVKAPSTYTPAYLTGDTGAQSNYLLWLGTADGSFRVTIDGVARNVDGINFTSGVASMADVATKIQTALRAVTGSTETVTWAANHFVITSANTTSSSAITVLSTSTGTVGTDISGAGASDWMDADVGNGVVTNAVLDQTQDVNKIPALGSDGKINSLMSYTVPGVMFMWPAAVAPTGFLICDGASLLRASYADLFAVIGTTYGAVDGTHFTLPDLKGKVVVGYNSAETEFDALGETGGEKTHTLTTNELPAHAHDIKGDTLGTGSGGVGNVLPRAAGAATGTTANAGGGAAHNNLQPYITLNYIIKT